MNAGPLHARTLTGAEILVRILEAEGVDTVFGYPGGAILPSYDALRGSGIHHVLVRHEQGAAHMADGYARASGNVGVAIATSGPGALNLVTGLATAMMDSVPMVCLTGQVPSSAIGTDAFQESDVLGVVTPITKHAILVRRVEDLAGALREAFGVARSGRPGPVVVDLCKDAQTGRCVLEDPGPFVPPRHAVAPPTDEELQDAIAHLAGAERPLILCGHGVTASGASSVLQGLAERGDIPVACTLLGLGAFPAGHRLHVGMIGMHGHAWANRAVQEADCILAVGMRFDDRVTGDPATFAPGASILHVELDPAEIGKVIDTDVGLCGDARAILLDLLHRLPASRRPTWRARLRAIEEAERAADPEEHDDGSMSATHVLRELGRLVGRDVIVATDVGQHQMWEAQHWAHERPRTLLTSGGLGTMGYALPAAIGASFAGRSEEIWVVVGDGGFQMTAAELSTLRQEGRKLHILIVNNSRLGMVRQLQEMFYGQRYHGVDMAPPDFVLLAQAHGLRAERVTGRDQLAAAIAAARAHPGSSVLELVVPEDEIVYPMVPNGGSLSRMIRHPDHEES